METIVRIKAVSDDIGRVFLAMVLVLACSLASCTKAPSNQNLAANGDLTQGYGERPADWIHISSRYLEQGQGTEDFGWIHRPGAPGELWLIAHEINLIDWEQTIALAPGIYHLSSEIWADDSDSLRGVGVDLQFGTNSLALKGFDLSVPSGWKRGDLYFKVGKRRKVQISCNLMGRSTRVRSAFFRRINLVKLSEPPADAASLTDLDAYGEASVKQGFRGSRAFPRPEGDAWTVLGALFVFAAVSVYGWIALGASSRN